MKRKLPPTQNVRALIDILKHESMVKVWFWHYSSNRGHLLLYIA